MNSCSSMFATFERVPCASGRCGHSPEDLAITSGEAEVARDSWNSIGNLRARTSMEKRRSDPTSRAGSATSSRNIPRDVLNLLHVTALYGAAWRYVSRKLLRRKVHPLISRGPWEVRRALRHLPLRYRVKGYYILLPPLLPVVHVTLGERVTPLAYGLANSH